MGNEQSSHKSHRGAGGVGARASKAVAAATSAAATKVRSQTAATTKATQQQAHQQQPQQQQTKATTKQVRVEATSPTSTKEPRVVTMEPSAHTFADPNNKRRDKSGPVMITDALSDVRVKYHINPKELGHGHYGVVRKCMDRETKDWYAIKSIRKSKVSKIEVLLREIEILKEVQHPNIIRLVDVFEDSKYLHLVTELCTGGELFDRIIAKTQSEEGHYSEHDAASLVRDILDAIAYCHDVKQIVHRDLKPENFLFLTEAEDSPIKIIDFGLSRHDDSNHGIMKTKVGTPYYVAPEVLRREYTKKCDIWSIGVITYILLCGYPPFYGDSDTEIFDSVRSGNFDFPSPEWDDISDGAKDFVSSMLKKDPESRPSAKEATNHKWILHHLDPRAVGQDRRSSSSVFCGERSALFQKFLAMQKLKKAALVVIASKLTQAEVGSLGDIFRRIDKENDGVITLTELDNAMIQGKVPSDIQNDINVLREELSLTGTDTLNWKVFLAATMDKHLVMREDKIRLAFNHFKNSDADCLTRSDFETVFKGDGQAREIFDYLDTDGDGRVSFEDFRNAIEQVVDPEDA